MLQQDPTNSSDDSIQPSGRDQLSPLTSPQSIAYKLVTESDAITSHFTEQAKRRIVHVDLIHAPAITQLTSTDEMIVGKFLNQSVAAVDRFTREFKLNAIAADGLTAESSDWFNRSMPLMRELINDNQRRAEFLRVRPNLQESVENFMLGYRFSAWIRAACDLNLKLIGLEDSEILKEEQRILGSSSSFADPKLVASFSARETALLRNFAKQKDDTVIIMFGAGHSLIEKVAEWNEQNPSSKTSLTEVRLVGIPKERHLIVKWLVEEFSS